MSRRELALLASLLLASLLVVVGVAQYDPRAAWILSGVLLACIALFALAEVGE